MTSPREQVDSLIARAVHPTTPIEESRSCARIAITIIAKHGLLDAASQAQRLVSEGQVIEIERLRVARTNLEWSLRQAESDRDRYKLESERLTQLIADAANVTGEDVNDLDNLSNGYFGNEFEDGSGF